MEAENRHIIVSGLTPRESVDFKPYNQSLKDICNENDLHFIDNYDSFLLASGEMPESYFYGDKLHLNASGTRRLLSNIDKVHNINRNSPRNDHTTSSQGFRPRGNTRQPRGKGSRPLQQFCRICMMNSHNTRNAGTMEEISHRQCMVPGRNIHGV